VLAQKTSLVKKLLLSAKGEEVRYIVRILVSNLRIGAVRLTLLTALARSFCLSRPPTKGEGSVQAEESEFWITEEEREVMQKVEMEELIKLESKAAKKKQTNKKKKQKSNEGDEDKDEVEVQVEEEDKKPLLSGAATSLKTKPRKDRTEIELRVEAKLVKAVQVVRKVWARHPNFGHLCKALLEGGLDGLEERVGLSVGE
jgi:DNA ligase-1